MVTMSALFGTPKIAFNLKCLIFYALHTSHLVPFCREEWRTVNIVARAYRIQHVKLCLQNSATFCWWTEISRVGSFFIPWIHIKARFAVKRIWVLYRIHTHIYIYYNRILIQRSGRKQISQSDCDSNWTEKSAAPAHLLLHTFADRRLWCIHSLLREYTAASDARQMTAAERDSLNAAFDRTNAPSASI